jgi:hypothetical protein
MIYPNSNKRGAFPFRVFSFFSEEVVALFSYWHWASQRDKTMSVLDLGVLDWL